MPGRWRRAFSARSRGPVSVHGDETGGEGKRIVLSGRKASGEWTGLAPGGSSCPGEGAGEGGPVRVKRRNRCSRGAAAGGVRDLTPAPPEQPFCCPQSHFS